MGNLKAAGLRRVEDAPIGDHGSHTLAVVHGGPGTYQLVAVRQVDHVHVGAKHVRFGDHEPGAVPIVVEPVGDSASVFVEHVGIIFARVIENEIIGDEDGVERPFDRLRLPDQRAVPCIQATYVAVLRGFVGLVRTAQVQPSVFAGHGAASGHVVLGGRPEHLAGHGVQGGGQALVPRLAPSLCCVAEEGGVVNGIAHQAQSGIVPARAQVREIPAPQLFARLDIPSAHQGLIVSGVAGVVMEVNPIGYFLLRR